MDLKNDSVVPFPGHMPRSLRRHGLETGEWWLPQSPVSTATGRIRAPSRVLLEAYSVPSRRARLGAAVVRAIDWFIPSRAGSLFHRVDARRSARMLVGFCFVAAVATLPLALMRLAAAPVRSDSLGLFLPQAVLVLCPLLLRWTKRPTLPALVVPSLGLVLLLLACLGPAGLGAPEIVLAPLVPVVAVPLLGPRAALGFGAATTAVIVAAAIVHSVHGGAGAELAYPALLTTSLGWAALALVLGYEHQRFALERRLQDALRDLERSAVIDPLTKVHNRRFFANRLSAEYSHAVRHHDDFGVIVFDLDHFKKVNDTHGHDAGDAVLVDTAQRVYQALRQEDVFARYGGEEFVVLSRNDATGLRRLAERLRLVIACEPVAAPSGAIQVTASFGCATLQASGAESADDLVRAADRCLYAAKSRGRNRVVAVDDPEPEVPETTREAAALTAALASLPPEPDRSTKIWYTGAG